jgi:hypothetical protein
MIRVAAQSIFSLFSPNEDAFANSLPWKKLLWACTTLLWEGERDGRRVTVWGGRDADRQVPGQAVPSSE